MIAHRKRLPQTPTNQQGAALFIGLVILLVLFVIVLAGSRDALLQERMTGHFKESNDSFQAVEDVLRQIEVTMEQDLEAGVVPSLPVEQWVDTGMPVTDCGGTLLRDDPDFDDWNLVSSAGLTMPATVRADSMFFRVVEMSKKGGNVTCALLEDNGNGGVFVSSYYLIMVRAMSLAGTEATPRAEQLAFSTFNFRPN